VRNKADIFLLKALKKSVPQWATNQVRRADNSSSYVCDESLDFNSHSCYERVSKEKKPGQKTGRARLGSLIVNCREA
jgi:hypothetical protein